MADHHGDGVIDRVVDYVDEDGDGDADVQVLYLLTPNVWSRTDMTCVVIADADDDNQFWRLIDYEYDQRLCQWESDFSGDNWFVMGRYDEGANAWVSHAENPFCFYDPDHDGCSEAAVRLQGVDLRASSLRYSLDADNDSNPDNPYDYDLSVTALGPVAFDPAVAGRYPLRQGVLLPFVAWDAAVSACLRAGWSEALLCWDENDRNVSGVGLRDRGRERWEGVIAPPWEGFPLVGGPPVSRLNKRFELDSDFSGRMQFYVSQFDLRLHLYGAEQGGMEVDLDDDGKPDVRWTMEDTDGDEFFDQWDTHWDDDGEPDVSVRWADARPSLIPADFSRVHAVYAPLLRRAVAQNLTLLEALRRSTPLSATAPLVCEALAKSTRALRGDHGLEAARYTGDLAVDRALAATGRSLSPRGRGALLQAWTAGDHDLAVELLTGEGP